MPPERPVQGRQPSPSNASHAADRRRLVKAGAILVPAILTLRATPAWAQTDYTVTAYTYGLNAGLCRNPEYNAGISADPCKNSKAAEFVYCDTGQAPGCTGTQQNY